MEHGDGEKAGETRYRAGVQSSDRWNGAAQIGCLVVWERWREGVPGKRGGPVGIAVATKGMRIVGNALMWDRRSQVAVAVAVRGSEAAMMQTRPRIGGRCGSKFGVTRWSSHAHHAKLRMPLYRTIGGLYQRKHNVYRAPTHSIAIVHFTVDIPTVIQLPTQALLPVVKRNPSSIPSRQTKSPGLR